jgi:hypothetical protein
MLVDVPIDEFTSEAKEVLPAIRPLEINEAVRLTLYGTFVFPPFLATVNQYSGPDFQKSSPNVLGGRAA